MKWSEQAWKSTQPIFEQILKLPFINELMKGVLPEEKFLFYLQQDAIYLSEYGKILSGIASRLNNPLQRQAFLGFAGDTVLVEQALHESYLKKIKEISETEASPSCLLYTGFLQKQLTDSPVWVAIASVLPCFWIYKKAGDYILANQVKGNNPYQQWIDTYGGDEFEKATKKALDIADKQAALCTIQQRAIMTRAFVLASRMEWMFWNSAWNMEQWPV